MEASDQAELIEKTGSIIAGDLAELQSRRTSVRPLLKTYIENLDGPYCYEAMLDQLDKVPEISTKHSCLKLMIYFSKARLLEAMRADWGAAADGVLRVDGGMTASDWTMQFLAEILGALVAVQLRHLHDGGGQHRVQARADGEEIGAIDREQLQLADIGEIEPAGHAGEQLAE